MKTLVIICFPALFLPALAQKTKFHLNAVGIDGFKNLPFLVVSQNDNGFNRYYNPIIFEGYGAFTTKKPKILLNLGLGYAAIDHQIQQRLTQHVTGYYIKIGRERYNKLDKERSFWGYNFTLTSVKVASAIDIKGNYFPSYQTPLPTQSRLGLSGDIYMGIQFLLFRRLEARFIARYTLVLSKVGSPNATYLPGAGIRFLSSPFTLSGGGTIQLFYLTKRVPKSVISD